MMHEIHGRYKYMTSGAESLSRPLAGAYLQQRISMNTIIISSCLVNAGEDGSDIQGEKRAQHRGREAGGAKR